MTIHADRPVPETAVEDQAADPTASSRPFHYFAQRASIGMTEVSAHETLRLYHAAISTATCTFCLLHLRSTSSSCNQKLASLLGCSQYGILNALVDVVTIVERDLLDEVSLASSTGLVTLDVVTREEDTIARKDLTRLEHSNVADDDVFDVDDSLLATTDDFDAAFFFLLVELLELTLLLPIVQRADHDLRKAFVSFHTVFLMRRCHIQQ